MISLEQDIYMILMQFPWRDFGVDPMTLQRAIPEVASDLIAVVNQHHLSKKADK